jgi:hypothetical protein
MWSQWSGALIGFEATLRLSTESTCEAERSRRRRVVDPGPGKRTEGSLGGGARKGERIWSRSSGALELRRLTGRNVSAETLF